MREYLVPINRSRGMMNRSKRSARTFIFGRARKRNPGPPATSVTRYPDFLLASRIIRSIIQALKKVESRNL